MFIRYHSQIILRILTTTGLATFVFIRIFRQANLTNFMRATINFGDEIWPQDVTKVKCDHEDAHSKIWENRYDLRRMLPNYVFL